MDTTQRAKAKQFTSKNVDLLNEKKYYEFAQKVKLLAHRKFQSKKMDEAAAMFLQGALSLYSIQEVEKNVPLELMDQLVDIYTAEPKLLTKDSQAEVIQLLVKRSIEVRELELVKKLLSKCGKVQELEIIAKFYVSECKARKRYAAVEKFAANFDLDYAWKFVEEWSACPGVTKQQIPALWCRLCLIRTLIHGLKEGQETFKKVSEQYKNDNPYVIFTGFLIKSGLLSSKQAYQTIERSYKQFLETDPIFESLFFSFGAKFFGIQRKKGGLLSMLE